MNPAEYAKAIAGGIIAGLGVLYVALADNSVSFQEWVAVASGALTAFATVWGVPNASKKETVTQHVMTITKQDVTPEHVEDQVEAPKHLADPVG